MREKVARNMHAAYAKKYSAPGLALPDWERIGPGPQEGYLLYADAALSALETPDDDMCFAGANALVNEMQAPSATLMSLGFTAMIRAAKGPTP